MALLTEIVQETADSFGLGDRAPALVAEALRLVFNERNGGLRGLLDRCGQAGLGDLADNWCDSHAALKLLDGGQLEKVVGAAAIAEAGKTLGMANARVRTAMAFVIPRLVRLFAAGGKLPREMPSAVQAFLRSDAARPRPPAGKPRTPVTSKPSHAWLGWTVGTLALLLTAGYSGLQILGSRDGTPPLAPPPPPPAAAIETPAAPMPEPEPGKPIARLTIRNDGGRFEYAGEVGDAGMKTAIGNQLLTFFGQARLSGNLDINPLVGVPPWFAKLDRVLPQLNVPGTVLRLEGNTARLGGWLSDPDRESVLNSIRTAMGPGFRYGYLGDETQELAQESRSRALQSLAALPPAYQGQDIVAILNQWVILFAEDSAALPDSSREVIYKAAELMRIMAQPVVFEIGGHTDNQGNVHASQKLSLERAVVVKNAFIQAGLPEPMVRARGYGGTRPIAANDTPYGQFRNRRIEFAVLEPCLTKSACGLPDPAAILEPPPAPVLEPLESLEPLPEAISPPVVRESRPAAAPAEAAPEYRPRPRSRPRDTGGESAATGSGRGARPASGDESGARPAAPRPARSSATPPPGTPGKGTAGKARPAETKKPATSAGGAPASTTEPKKTDAAAPKPKPKPAPAPRMTSPGSVQDLF